MTDSFNIFVVEGEDDLGLLIRRTLERDGHHVAACHCGVDALTVLCHTACDLVLLDYHLPDMNGSRFLNVLGSQGIHVPVLVMADLADREEAAQLLRAGALDYLMKDNDLSFLAELPKRARESVKRYRLQETNRLLIHALESASDGIIITDLHGTIKHVNRSLEQMMGYTREEMIGQSLALFESGLGPDNAYANIVESIRSRGSWQGELINRRKDDTLFDASLAVSPVVDQHGQSTHAVGIYRDNSERKQLERQLLQAQKMQSIGTLAGGVAHEFNNLLAGIHGYASLAMREIGLSNSMHEYLQYIIQLSERAADLTRQLLAYARKPTLARQPTRIDQLLRSTVELLRHSLCIDVQFDMPTNSSDDQMFDALVDGNQLQQVLINLALNARDAIRALGDSAIDDSACSNRILFSLRDVHLDGELPGFPDNVPPGNYLVIEVQDNGTGMSQEVLSQAFDPFFTTKGVGQGTGLGLSVAYGIVHVHQGFLSVATAAGQGTCISTYLPRLQSEQQISSTTDADPPTVEPQSVTGKDILVIDDESAVLDVVRRFLELAGHHVRCVSSGKDAIACLDGGEDYDLAILDLMIPREEWTRTVSALNELRPQMPILLSTALMPEAEWSSVLKGNVVGAIHKPFWPPQLWSAVHQALQNHMITKNVATAD